MESTEEIGVRLLAAYLDETSPSKGDWHKIKAQDYASGRAILEADELILLHVLLATFHLPAAKQLFSKIFVVQPLIQAIFRCSNRFSDADLLRLCQEVVEHSVSDFDFGTKRWLVRYIEAAALRGSLSETLRRGAALIESSLLDDNPTADAFKLSAQIQTLLNGPAENILHQEEAWGAAVLADCSAMTNASDRSAWRDLLTHTLDSDASKPSAKWLADAQLSLDTLGIETAKAQVIRWLEKYVTTSLPAPEPTGDGYDDYVADKKLMTLANHNYQAVKGIVWLCRCFDGSSLTRLLGDVTVHSLKKIPGHGPKSAKVGTACILTLASMGGFEPITQLNRIKTHVTYQATLGVLAKALDEAASRARLTPDDMEELAVPNFGLNPQGNLREQLGDYQAVLQVTAAGKVELNWTDIHGKALKSVPSALKREHAESLKLLKRTVSELQETVQLQRSRLENAMRNQQTWPLHLWRERYLAHPVLGLLTRRLIWRFGDQVGIIKDSQIENENGLPLTELQDETPVQLWHPLTTAAGRVFAWRIYLEAHEITQPFKQAHREVYLLTDAERETRVYSHRFAAHILKQHQFSALCRERGWKYALQGGWDGHNVPTLQFPIVGLSASFVVDGVREDALSNSGIYLYVTTGTVTFFRPANDDTPIPLSDVPPLAFSEIMRDVDLFVGVASVGNDPAWADGGPEGRFQNYWQDYAFGDLGETAKTRAAVLAKLLPRLRIASRCVLDGKFLVVRGDVRTYKIHLGSGNILMEPNDQYLCIVPGRSEDTGDVFLPFEGDRVLAIILSKAFLLADDTKIADPTITRQIRLFST